MSDWILLRNESELEAKAKALRRKCRGHYYTNYYFLHSSRGDELRYTEMFYQEDGDNLYAIERVDDFYQFFYFVGDVDGFRLDLPPSVEGGVMTCEFSEVEGKEKQGPVLERLYQEGFADYKNFHYYTYKYAGEKIRRLYPKGYDLNYQASVEELSVMYDVFDPYTDALPPRRAFPAWLEARNILSCAVGGQYAGSILWRKDGWGNGHVFALDMFPGVGAYLTLEKRAWNIEKYPDKPYVITGLIEDNNIRSIQMHQRFGFKCGNQYHKVLIRRK